MKKTIYITLLLCFTAITNLQAKIYYAKATPTGTNSGNSWANAGSLLSMLDSAASGDSIWIRKGIYYPTSTSDRTISFELPNGVSLFGGFEGTETALNQRTNINLGNVGKTVLSGDIGTANDNSDNSYHILLILGNSTASTIDNIEFNNGNANLITGSFQGITRGNSYGAGVFIKDANGQITLSNCNFTNNNIATVGGGAGLFSLNNNTIVSKCLFLQNTGDGLGAAIYFWGGSYTRTVNGCAFLSNNSEQGGGIYNNAGTANITNSIFHENVSLSHGAAIYNANFGIVDANHCTFTGNLGNRFGIGGNVGKVLHNASTSSTITVANSILYNITVQSSLVASTSGAQAIAITYSNIQNGYTGTGNINLNPIFVSYINIYGSDNYLGTNDDGLNIRSCSPSYNTGNNSNSLANDIVTNTRPQNTTVDMGAYEQITFVPAPTRVYVNANATGVNDGTSWTDAYTDLQSALNNCLATNAEIWVAAATYKPTTGTTRSINFSVPSSVSVYGGFVGNETALSQRNFKTNVTTLSGDLGTVGSNSDNTNNIVSMSLGNTNTALDGFTITGANFSSGNRGAVNSVGGGGWVRNCIISDNTGYAFAALHYTTAAVGGIENCFFINNSSPYSAVGIDGGSNVPMNNCVFANNTTTNEATDLQLLNTTATITNCTFYGTSTTGSATIRVNASATPTFNNCNIWGANSNSFDVQTGSTATTINCNIRGGKTGSGTYTNTDSINRNPLFINTSDIDGADNLYFTADDGLAIPSNSPCVNEGNNTSVTAIDITGAARTVCGNTDIGAYEYAGTNRVYVKANATGANNGTSWANAYTDLQSALNACLAANAEIWVAAGTYKPSPSEVTSVFFNIPSGVRLYGGFNGTETLLSQRNVTTNVTILSGDYGTADTYSGTGLSYSISNNTTNAKLIAKIINPTQTVIVDGFTFRGGYGNIDVGAAINIDCPSSGINNKITISNCIFTRNFGTYGIVYSTYATPTFSNCNFTLNRNSLYSAGILAEYGSAGPIISKCTFTNNSSGDAGTAIYLYYIGKTYIDSCTFTNNISNNYGGAIAADEVNLKLTNSIFTGNGAPLYGGALSLDADYNGNNVIDTVANCVFDSCFAEDEGSALMVSSKFLNAYNNIFYRNTGVNAAGLIQAYSGGTINLTNNTMVGNIGGSSNVASIIDNYNNPNINLTNNVIYNNTPTTLVANGSGAVTNFTYNIGQTLPAGTGNISNTNPLFVNSSLPKGADGIWATSDDGFNLSACSPAKNTGTNTNAPATDIVGTTRPQFSIVDIGAYETTLQPTISRLYVKANATGSNNGTSWTDAYTDLQSALNNTCFAANAEIWVAAGTYKPTSGTDRTIYFNVPNNVKLYGGFVGTETAISQRTTNTVTAIGGGGSNGLTILSGDIGTANDSTDNSYHVLVVANATAAVIIDGFTLTKGNANSNSTFLGGLALDSRGAGLYAHNNGSNLTLTNLTFSSNTVTAGGAYFNTGTSPTISQCVWQQNSSVVNSGSNSSAILTITGNLNLSQCSFIQNSARGEGTVRLFGTGSTQTFSKCLFNGNTANSEGTGIHNSSSMTIQLSQSVFVNNSSGSNGGAVRFGAGTQTVDNCVFANNTATANGGAVSTGSNTSIRNSVFYGNSATLQGGAIQSNTNATISNCIIYNNTAPTGAGIHVASGTPTVEYSNVQGGFTGTGNINSNPLFVNVSDLDGADNIWGTNDDGLMLQHASPSVNTGNNTAASNTDINNTYRPQYSTVDIGAYEVIKDCKPTNAPAKLINYTYRGDTAATDAQGWTCYCDSLGVALLSLKLGGTGAVISPNQVQIKVSPNATYSSLQDGGMITNPDGYAILNKRWNVNPSTQPSSPVSVRYYFEQAEFDSLTNALAAMPSPSSISLPTQLQVYKTTSTSGFTNPHTTSGLLLNNGSTASLSEWQYSLQGTRHVAEFMVSSFSGGGIGFGGGGMPLPLEFIYFDAFAINSNSSKLVWQVSPDVQNGIYEIRRSTDGKNLISIGNVKHTFNTNSYQFLDINIPVNTEWALYQIVMKDASGKSILTEIKKVNFSTQAVFNIYPNPANNFIQILSNDENKIEQIKIMNTLGAILLNQAVETQNPTIDLSKLNAGVYIVQIFQNQQWHTQKLIKQ